MNKFLNKILNRHRPKEPEKAAEDRLPMEVKKEAMPVASNVLEVFCPYCASKSFVKRGTRQKKNERVQLYLCGDCQRTFTPGAVKGKHYPKAIILDAISLYHLGYSLEKACGIINKMIEKMKSVDNLNILADKKTAKISDSFVGVCPRDEDTDLGCHQDNLIIYQDKNNVKLNQERTGAIGPKGSRTPDILVTTQISSPEQAQIHTQPANVLYQKNTRTQKYENTGTREQETLKHENTEQKLQPSSLANWIKQYHDLCAYSRMREFGLKMYRPEDVIISATLAHRQLYRFRYHRAKTRLIIKEDFKNRCLAPLMEFLELVPAECPHEYFSQGLRASEAPIFFSKTEMIVRAKENYATKVAKFVLESVGENKDRHDALQRFMLANDSTTVATEVPVYIRREDLAHMQTQLGFQLYHKNIKTLEHENTLIPYGMDELPKLITGHIDFVQIRNGFIHIMDFKPKAARERPMEQLTLYALALSRLTGLRVYHFKCAWFDEKDYFEFFPLHMVYKRTKSRRKKIATIEGVYHINERMDKIENLRPTEV
ncbi:hypothetical protein COX27_00855 [Candidatus Kuenenbacteria bacterium CG23_combo_of_CG06-09_8_20_14_all_36_9]|nr:MAG: hypothetical protein COX27_00855 [Candidatus Kuenenbacteria bacterium CG23_combo_of_CG06-09_8_20_14_all_36_9]